MSSKIFRSVFFTSVFVLIFGFMMVFTVLFDYFETRVFSELESEAKYISYGIKENPDDFVKKFDNGGNRITLLSPNGDVIADSDADATSLENHSDREEVKAAIKHGSGKSGRYSDTLTEKTLYYAVRLENGNILRISATQSSVFVILLGFLQPIIVIVAIAMIISLALAYKVSSSIVSPINSIDVENPESAEAYEELTPLLKKLTAQKKTIRLQIREAEKTQNEFNLICENMNEGFLVLDSGARVLSHNSAALRLLEIDDIKNVSVLTLNRSRGFCEVVEAALDGRRAENVITVDECIYSLIANPVFQKGKNIGAVIVIIDVTESAKREQLRREFTSNVSHELKTPLTSISGFAEMMKNGGIDGETVKDFSRSIYDEAQRMINLVGDIMKISELDEGAVLCDTERIDLYSLAKNTAVRLAPYAKKQNIKINVCGCSAYVLGTRKILEEMICNLCDNAVKYNRENGFVEINVSADSEEVFLKVRDGGIGIPQSEQARVFERFYRVDKSRSKSEGGTGLGLAIVKHGAMYHNAKISLESSENVGTTIAITFVNADFGRD